MIGKMEEKKMTIKGCFFFFFFFSCKNQIKTRERRPKREDEIEIWIMRIMIIRIIIRKMKGSAVPDSSSPSYLV